jgi:hypothetical protein
LVLLTPREYTSWTTVVPQSSNQASKLGGMSSLAAMAGFNLNLGAGDDLAPAVYPQVVSSPLFLKELMSKTFFVQGAPAPVNLHDYFLNYYKPGLLQRLKGWRPTDNQVESAMVLDTVAGWKRPVEFSSTEEKVAELIQKQLSVVVDVKNGYITLNAVFQDAMLAAQVADAAREQLQTYITGFRIRKATEQLSFIEGRYREKKAEYQKAQSRLASVVDANKYLESESASVQEERLKSEYNIAASVYTELAKQLEQAQIQVKEDTPVFMVIQPAKVPHKPTKPRCLLMVTMWLFFGVIVGAGLVFGNEYWKNIQMNWNS